MDTQLVIIDPQNDFCDPAGSLYVPGAEADMARLADLVNACGRTFSQIHVTLDTHARWDIAHPLWWTTEDGTPPAPFTQITLADVEGGRIRTTRPADRDQALRYLRDLAAAGRFSHTIWPEHCIAGDWGHNVFPLLSRALHAWEAAGSSVQLLRKGENPATEHFSAVRAEVVDPCDPHTQPNRALVALLEKADRVLVAGEAATHCVVNTVLDLAEAFEDRASLKKVVWLSDATSPVPDPPGTTLFSAPLGRALETLTRDGMRVATIEQMRNEIDA